jgi:hypothetical protein
MFLLLISILIGTPAVLASEQSLFTRYNIHVQERQSRNGDSVYKASYANYVDPGEGHQIIPAGSKIEITDKNRKGFTFQVDSDKKSVTFEFHASRMQMSVDEYIDLITSPEPVSFAHLSKLDNKGRAEGRVFEGMSKKGVLAAFGYPAVHRTPSLDSSTWVYWANRFRTIGVDFNSKGVVGAIR